MFLPVDGGWSVQSEGCSAHYLLELLNHRNRRVFPVVKERLLVSPQFTPTTGVKFEFVGFEGRDFSAIGGKMRDVKNAAAEQGLKTPTLEAAMLLAVKYTSDELGIFESVVCHHQVYLESTSGRNRPYFLCIGSQCKDKKDIVGTTRGDGAQRVQPTQRLFFVKARP